MSKNRFKNIKYKAVEQVSKNVTKKGKIKGKNKKETKILKAVCTHHKRNKKGKLKPTIFNNNDGTCICTMCGKSFSAKLASKSDVKDAIKPIEELVNQSKYIGVACGLGQKTVDYFCNLGVMLMEFPKIYKKATNVASKQNKVGKNNRNRRTSGGSSRYGSWAYR